MGYVVIQLIRFSLMDWIVGIIVSLIVWATSGNATENTIPIMIPIIRDILLIIGVYIASKIIVYLTRHRQ